MTLLKRMGIGIARGSTIIALLGGCVKNAEPELVPKPEPKLKALICGTVEYDPFVSLYKNRFGDEFGEKSYSMDVAVALDPKKVAIHRGTPLNLDDKYLLRVKFEDTNEPIVKGSDVCFLLRHSFSHVINTFLTADYPPIVYGKLKSYTRK